MSLIFNIIYTFRAFTVYHDFIFLNIMNKNKLNHRITIYFSCYNIKSCFALKLPQNCSFPFTLLAFNNL